MIESKSKDREKFTVENRISGEVAEEFTEGDLRTVVKLLKKLITPVHTKLVGEEVDYNKKIMEIKVVVNTAPAENVQEKKLDIVSDEPDKVYSKLWDTEDEDFREGSSNLEEEKEEAE